MIKVNVKNNFTIVPNDIIVNPSLTKNSKLILIYLLSKPENWKVQIKDIQSNLSMGRDSVYSALNNLIDNQLMIRSKPRKDKNGQWSQVKYELSLEYTTSLKLGTGMWKESHLNKVTTSLKSGNINNTKTTNKKEPPTELVAHSLRFYKTYGFPKKCNNEDKLINESADVLRKLIEIDEYNLSDIKSAIRWGKDNQFWSKQIISLKSLRNKKSDVMKFENLYNQYKADINKPKKVDMINQVVYKNHKKDETVWTAQDEKDAELAKEEFRKTLKSLNFGVN